MLSSFRPKKALTARPAPAKHSILHTATLHRTASDGAGCQCGCKAEQNMVRIPHARNTRMKRFLKTTSLSNRHLLLALSCLPDDVRCLYAAKSFGCGTSIHGLCSRRHPKAGCSTLPFEKEVYSRVIGALFTWLLPRMSPFRSPEAASGFSAEANGLGHRGGI